MFAVTSAWHFLVNSWSSAATLGAALVTLSYFIVNILRTRKLKLEILKLRAEVEQDQGQLSQATLGEIDKYVPSLVGRNIRDLGPIGPGGQRYRAAEGHPSRAYLFLRRDASTTLTQHLRAEAEQQYPRLRSRLYREAGMLAATLALVWFVVQVVATLTGLAARGRSTDSQIDG